MVIWEQTATFATYSINWLIFITEMKSVYSAVRTASLNKALCAPSVNGLLAAGMSGLLVPVFFLDPLTLDNVPDRMSFSHNYLSTLRNDSEERRSHLKLDWRQKSRGFFSSKIILYLYFRTFSWKSRAYRIWHFTNNQYENKKNYSVGPQSRWDFENWISIECSV
jgi:hypothetical protein